MLATSVAVHEPSATSSSSTGDGADERCEFVSSTSARPPGVTPTNRSSATNRTTALPLADIHQLRRKHNTVKVVAKQRTVRKGNSQEENSQEGGNAPAACVGVAPFLS